MIEKETVRLNHTSPYHALFRTLLLTGSLLAAGCDLINPAEGIPSYIYVPALAIETQSQTQGSASAKITEVWLTVDGAFLGAYALPALIPVLAAGPTEITLEAGVKDNGITARPEIYPFYAPHAQRIDLAPERVDTIRPRIRYRDNIRFALIEDFERGTHVFQDLRRGDEVNRMTVSDENVFEGRLSGKIVLDKEHPLVELATRDRYRGLTDRGFQVYLEMDYQSEAPVVFGLVGRNNNNPANAVAVYDPGFLPKDTWNKIYFNLSLLALDNDFEEYQIALQAFLPEQNGVFTADKATVWLDNIKLIHF